MVKYFDKSEAAITWEEIKKADRRGDIINYTILYKADGGKELGTYTHKRQKVRRLS